MMTTFAFSFVKSVEESSKKGYGFDIKKERKEGSLFFSLRTFLRYENKIRQSWVSRGRLVENVDF